MSKYCDCKKLSVCKYAGGDMVCPLVNPKTCADYVAISDQKPVAAGERPGYVFNLTEAQMRELSTATMNELKNLHPITELPVATNEISELHKDIAAMANVYRIEGFRKGQEEMRGRCLIAVHSIQQDYPVIECNEDEHCPLCALDKAAAKINALKVKGE